MELVKVNHIIALQYGGGKQIIVPETLLVEWLGQQFLRIKATSSTIITLICGSCPKNASLAASDGLSELVSLRNKVAMGVSENNDEGEVFESAAKKDSKCTADKTVEVGCNGTSITVLWQGTRPSRSDLMALVDETMLAAVFQKIKATAVEALNSTKRSYQKKKAPP